MAESFALNASARELPLIHADPYLNNLLLKYCEAALAGRKGSSATMVVLVIAGSFGCRAAGECEFGGTAPSYRHGQVD